MSNLKSAKDALTAELSQAKAGLAHYQARAEALEKTLAQLAGVDAGTEIAASSEPHAKPMTGKKVNSKKSKASKLKPAIQSVNGNAGSAAAASPGPQPKPAAAKKAKVNKNDLPFTGGDYWTNLLSDQPQSGPEVLKSAIAKLGFTPTKEQVKQLGNRMTFALNTMVKAKKIKDSGKGRERGFFKA